MLWHELRGSRVVSLHTDLSLTHTGCVALLLAPAACHLAAVKALLKQLWTVQIFDYETKYLESCNPAGSALKGEQGVHLWQGVSSLFDPSHCIPFGRFLAVCTPAFGGAPLQCVWLAACKAPLAALPS